MSECPQRRGALDRRITIDRSRAVPIRRQIVDQIIDAIRSGDLAHDDPVPSSRTLASGLGVARSTVVSCYLELEGEGWLEPVPGAGTFVSHRRLDSIAPQDAGTSPTTPSTNAPAARFDLRTGRVDPTLVTSRAWRTAWHQTGASSYPSPPCGEPTLIHHLAGYLRSARGIDVTGDELVVCAGIGEALVLLTLALGWIGRTVVIEDPCYWQVRAALTRLGVSVTPVDASDPASFARTVRAMSPPPAAVYLTPNHQYPLGHRMDDEHRGSLLEWAARSGSLIVEDDYNSEFRFNGPAPDTLSSWTTPAQVAYFATMSKTLDPGLRLAYLKLPPTAVDAVRSTRRDIGTTTSRSTQLVVARLLRSGEVSRHTARLRRVYGDRRLAMLRGLSTVPMIHEIHGTEAGLHIVAELDPRIAAADVVTAAAHRGVLVNDLDDYRAAPDLDRPAIVLGFAQLTPADLRTAIATLRDLPVSRSHSTERTRDNHAAGISEYGS